jgi:hypothetical protein
MPVWIAAPFPWFTSCLIDLLVKEILQLPYLLHLEKCGVPAETLSVGDKIVQLHMAVNIFVSD